MQTEVSSLDILWLARALWELGAVTFGTFTVGSSPVSSPVFINPKLLIGNPIALRVAAKLMHQEIEMAQSLRHPRAQPYDVVAGVPVGGLLLAVAYSLETNTPLIYPRPRPEGTGPRGVEGRYTAGSRVLLIEDLATGGGGIAETARFLMEHELVVRDAVVLIDRGHSATEALRQAGINLLSILKLDVMMTHYLASGLIDDAQYQRYEEYVAALHNMSGKASGRKATPEGAEQAPQPRPNTPTPGTDPT